MRPAELHRDASEGMLLSQKGKCKFKVLRIQNAAARENTELFPGPYLWLDFQGFIQYLELLLGLGFLGCDFCISFYLIVSHPGDNHVQIG